MHYKILGCGLEILWNIIHNVIESGLIASHIGICKGPTHLVNTDVTMRLDLIKIAYRYT